MHNIKIFKHVSQEEIDEWIKENEPISILQMEVKHWDYYRMDIVLAYNDARSYHTIVADTQEFVRVMPRPIVEYDTNKPTTGG